MNNLEVNDIVRWKIPVNDPWQGHLSVVIQVFNNETIEVKCLTAPYEDRVGTLYTRSNNYFKLVKCPEYLKNEL